MLSRLLLTGSGTDLCFKISKHQRVRIAYLGRMLKENESLIDQGWQAGNVINALVAFQVPRP